MRLRKISYFLLFVLILAFTTGCSGLFEYTISGKVVDLDGNPIEGMKLVIDGEQIEQLTVTEFDERGSWSAVVEGAVTVTPVQEDFNFRPRKIELSKPAKDVDFVGSPVMVGEYPIGGVVVDEFGNPIPGVEILIVGEQRQRFEANQDGTWDAVVSGVVDVLAGSEFYDFEAVTVMSPDDEIVLQGVLKGLLLYYPFEKVEEGVTPDLSPFGFHASLEGTAGLTKDGVKGNALSLDGMEGTFLNIPVEAFEGLPELTISLWLKYYDYKDWQTFFHFASEADFVDHFTWLIMGEGNLQSGYCDEGHMNTHIDKEEWVHLAATLTADKFTYYLNGYREGRVCTVDLPLEELYPLRFIWMGFYYGRPHMRADIDEVRVYDRALPAEVILGLYNADAN